MDVKGHNYRQAQRDARHYGNKQPLKSTKQQMRKVSREIELLKADRQAKSDELRALKETSLKENSKQYNNRIGQLGKEIEKTDTAILRNEEMLNVLKKSKTISERKKRARTRSAKSGADKIGSGVKKKAKNGIKSSARTTAELIKRYADSNDDGTQAALATTKISIRATTNTAKSVGKTTYRTATYYPRKIIKKTARKVVNKTVKTIVKAFVKIVKAIAKAAANIISKLITALIVSGGWVVVLILIAVVLLCILIVKFDVGWFIGGNTNVAQTVSNRYIAASQYLGTLQSDFNKQVNREASGSPVYDDDISNINDMLITYICLTFDVDSYNDSDNFTEADKEILKDIFYTMCEYEVETKAPDDDTPDEHGNKPQPEIVSCTITRHNLAWAINKYEFTEEQKATLQIVSQLSNGLVSADGTQVITPGDSDDSNNMISGYVPDINISLTWPTTSNKITSAYNDTAGRDKPHKGVDVAPVINGVAGDPVYAVADGEVKIAQWNNATAGTYVAIAHEGGLYTRYLHMCDLCVSAGESVNRGQLIGHMGTTGDSTGVHLHFDFAHNGAYINPMAYFNN